ncbi:MAG: valine--tRNA ligase [Rickettsiales bacterium]|nr:valine--tRNA ligase [Rickettsiales bacterium]
MKDLPQKYDHKDTESRWQQHWVQAGTYHYHGDQPRENSFVIDTPPPTVSGQLHMGHVFSYTQCDFVARYQRMKGKDVFYPMGFDDNGLPTERLVEKATKKRATDFESREAFIAECEKVSEEARQEFRNLFQSTALSVDWRKEYHTISPEVRALSQESFLDLMEKGEVERRLEPMLWDPVDQTAIAQAEVEDKELPSHFHDIRFDVEGGGDFVIGTTRPELIPACVSIFYHPDDVRYQHLNGKKAITPLFGVKVDILEDDSVEMEKGTGIMMCCTFGDEADIEKWRKHKLPARIVLNKYGKMDLAASDWLTQNATTEALQNKKASNPDKKHPGARQIIVELLEESGHLVKSEPITHAVKCAERSGAPLEIIPTQQWFVKVLDKQEALLARSKECTWYPEWMQLRMQQWIEGLSWDWCISRQRYYGVPFPVWYSKRPGEEGKVLLADRNSLPVNPLSDLPAGYTADEVEPDADVMDTWATSSISPQINAGSLVPNALYPADLRPQAHEIIRTWAFYTLVKSHLHADTIPWKNLMISGWCLAEDKTKMSKSKGNVVTPVELIETEGTDAVRYWAATSKLGTDTAFSKDLLKIGKKLVTKLFNATKFAAIHLEKYDGDAPVTEALDRWLISRVHHAVSAATAAFEKYEYARALDITNDLFWNDLCDNYLELVKGRVYDEEGANLAGQQSAVQTLYLALQTVLKLYAPFVPHVTEELYSHIYAEAYRNSGSIHAQGQWPDAAHFARDAQAEQSGEAAVQLLGAIRKAKSERGVSIKFPVAQVMLQLPEGLDAALVAPVLADVKAAGNVEDILLTPELPEAALASEDGRFHLSVRLAEQADVA